MSGPQTEIALGLIEAEYQAAMKKHPGFADGSYHLAMSILTEEVGEAAKALNDMDTANLGTELAQVAAVCRRFLEMLLI